MKSAFFLTIFALLAFSCTRDTASTESTVIETVSEAMPDSKQLRHVVLFSFKETSSAEEVASVEAAFSDLKNKISEIKDYEWGINNSPENLNKGFTHCFFVTFDSEEGRAAYLPHPDHKAFVELLGPHLEDVLVIDYWTGE